MDIEPKLCLCGCNQPTEIATASNNLWHHVKGQPKQYCRGHNPQKRNHAEHLDDGTTRVLLTRRQGESLWAIVDTADYDLIKAFHWSPLVHKHYRTKYAFTVRQGQNVYMHHILLGTHQDTSEIDHEDHDGLNNQRSNLR